MIRVTGTIFLGIFGYNMLINASLTRYSSCPFITYVVSWAKFLPQLPWNVQQEETTLPQKYTSTLVGILYSKLTTNDHIYDHLYFLKKLKRLFFPYQGEFTIGIYRSTLEWKYLRSKEVLGWEGDLPHGPLSRQDVGADRKFWWESFQGAVVCFWFGETIYNKRCQRNGLICWYENSIEDFLYRNRHSVPCFACFLGRVFLGSFL